MRIMIDANVLVSGLLFSHSQVSTILEYIARNHQLVISSYVLEEFKAVVVRKFSHRIGEADALLEKLSYELVYTPDAPEPGIFFIRDAADYPVLYTAILEGVDVLVTGDKDFADAETDVPEILTPRQFMDLYMQR